MYIITKFLYHTSHLKEKKKKKRKDEISKWASSNVVHLAHMTGLMMPLNPLTYIQESYVALRACVQAGLTQSIRLPADFHLGIKSVNQTSTVFDCFLLLMIVFIKDAIVSSVAHQLDYPIRPLLFQVFSNYLFIFIHFDHFI